jgi:predicted dehydrogenase
MRFGLVGTGFWAREVHAPALADSPDVEFVGIWGRGAGAAAALAADHRTTAYQHIDELVADVDAMAFAVPPDVQAEYARVAAEAGKHLLLDKPVATSAAAAEDLARAVREAEVASVVFFTARFQPEVRAWLADATSRQWTGASGRWICSAFSEASPFRDSQWRRERGALWDAGPHALAVLLPAVGDVVAVSAMAGRGDLVHLLLRHDGGGTSTLTLTLTATEAAGHVGLDLWDDAGRSTMPATSTPPVEAMRTAVAELVRSATSGCRAHPVDAAFGCRVAQILEEAERVLTAP